MGDAEIRGWVNGGREGVIKAVVTNTIIKSSSSMRGKGTTIKVFTLAR